MSNFENDLRKIRRTYGNELAEVGLQMYDDMQTDLHPTRMHLYREEEKGVRAFVEFTRRMHPNSKAVANFDRREKLLLT